MTINRDERQHGFSVCPKRVNEVCFLRLAKGTLVDLSHSGFIFRSFPANLNHINSSLIKTV
jgi:hypothetical protein